MDLYVIFGLCILVNGYVVFDMVCDIYYNFVIFLYVNCWIRKFFIYSDYWFSMVQFGYVFYFNLFFIKKGKNDSKKEVNKCRYN